MKLSFDIFIVTYNSERYIETCLLSLFNQTYKDFRAFIWDNDSKDKTLEIVNRFKDKIFFIKRNRVNVGFSKAINNLIEISDGDYLIFLNPDVILPIDFLKKTSDILKKVPDTIIPVPKLLRYDDNFNPTNVVDSAGIYWTPFQRHLDRGSGRQDYEKYKKETFVGGVSGAVSIWSKNTLEKLAIEINGYKEYLDEDFFVYREDADISLRALICGYKFKFIPELIGYHKRQVLPNNRKKVAGTINYHSFKNRFLLRIKNIPFVVYIFFFLTFTLRDLLAFGYVVLYERKSLKAVWFIFKNLKRFLKKRKQVLIKRKISLLKLIFFFLGKYR